MGDARRVRLHVDTDLGSDPDDACALAMVLGMPDVDLVGVTTTRGCVADHAADARRGPDRRAMVAAAGPAAAEPTRRGTRPAGGGLLHNLLVAPGDF